MWTSASITVAPEPQPDQPGWQQWAISVCRSRWFEALVIGVIIINAISIGIHTYAEQSVVLEWLDIPIVLFFTVEIIIRLAAHGFQMRRFLAQPWNVFDLVVVLSSVIPHVAGHITILRSVRLLRIARLLRIMPDIGVLVEGIKRAIAPAFSLGSIIALGTYIYAVLGYMMFSRTVPERFGDVGEGMLTLFQLLTLEAWNEILDDLRAASPYGMVYTVAFVICATYVVVNFVVGVIITSLEDAYEAKRGVSEDDMMELLHRLETKVDTLQEELDRERRRPPQP